MMNTVTLAAHSLRRCCPALPILVLGTVLGCRDEPGPTAPADAVSPAAATAASLSFRQVSAGRSHTCGVTTSNQAYCWGSNAGSQLGLGSGPAPETCDFGFPCSSRPLAVAGAIQFRSVSAGDAQTCGVTTNDRIYCWGSGYSGNGTTGTGSSPVRLAGTRSYRQVGVGQSHTCALDTAGRIYCWGANTWGQLGDGTRTERLTPVRVRAGTLRFRRLAVGAEHTCGIATNDRLYCWGHNGFGQLGDRTKTDRPRPVAVSGGVTFKDADGGALHTCAVTPENRAYCWGAAGEGQLGDGTDWPRRLKPVRVLGGLSLTRVSAGTWHTCGETRENRIYCWGNNELGALGDGSTTGRSTPVATAGGLSFDQVTAGERFTCGVAGSVAYCWGSNRWGQLGDGTRQDRLVPTRVQGS